jgi:HTH-type transcriptional regulator/antitoxin HigA
MVYQPDKAIHPGKTVQKILDELNMTQKKLAERTGLSEKHISQIINGEASITADTAMLFENALGGSASFWINLDKNYRATFARLEQENKARSEVNLLDQFPYGELIKLNRVEATLDKVKRVVNLWRFFGVNSLSSIPSTEAAAYRRGYNQAINQGALAAWLRCGEIDMQKINFEVSQYDENVLKRALPTIRSLTRQTDENFFNKTQRILASAGVGLIAVQHLKGTRASGATRWIGDNPLIQISIYGRDADKFWFTRKNTNYPICTKAKFRTWAMLGAMVANITPRAH